MAWIIVGLGNPGEEYHSTRHNSGRMAVEFFARAADLNGFRADKVKKATVAGGMVGKSAVALILPDTYMNKSGSAVGKYVKSQPARGGSASGGKTPAERLIVAYDDLDLPLGTMKISFDRSSGGHKGLESVIRAVKTQRFTRVRIGVSPSTAAGSLRKPEGKKVVNNFILTKFGAHELAVLKPVLKRVAEALRTIVLEGREQAMNRFN